MTKGMGMRMGGVMGMLADFVGAAGACGVAVFGYLLNLLMYAGLDPCLPRSSSHLSRRSA